MKVDFIEKSKLTGICFKEVSSWFFKKENKLLSSRNSFIFSEKISFKKATILAKFSNDKRKILFQKYCVAFYDNFEKTSAK